ncbi:MAG: hypothetical protein EBY29_16630, partial [Planctomycetes bacterium]|nr:hypothetical protein [Planctomycetota bacterium]
YQNSGVFNDGGIITSGGTGSVTVIGTGGSGERGLNGGVVNYEGTITSGGGDVTVTGIGGTGVDGSNCGVFNYGVNSAGTITSVGGAVTVTGTGGTGGSDNDAILMGLDSVVDAPGDLTLISNRGAINQTSGTITVVGATTITAGTGPTFFDVTLAQSTNDFVGAVSVVSANNVSLADTNALTLGASTVANNFTATASGGIVVADDITAGGIGEINITGNTNTNISLRSKFGVTVNDNVTIQTTNGNLNITGTGGSALSGANFGVYNAVGTIKSSGGDVTVVGIGGTSDGGSNYGVNSAGTITSVGGAVTVTGTGGSGGAYNIGIINYATISSGGGNVLVTGVAGSVGYQNSGVFNDGGIITSGGTGSVTVIGTGGSGER